MLKHILLLLVLVLAIHAMNSAAYCNNPGGCGGASCGGVTEEAATLTNFAATINSPTVHAAKTPTVLYSCSILCSGLKTSTEKFVCPTLNWHANVEQKFCGPQQCTARTGPPTVDKVAGGPSVADTTAAVKAACVKSGCYVVSTVRYVSAATKNFGATAFKLN